MEDVGDPGGSAGGIGDQIGAVARREFPAEFGNDFVIYRPPAKPAESENDLGAFRIFRGNKAWGYVTKNDF